LLNLAGRGERVDQPAAHGKRVGAHSKKAVKKYYTRPEGGDRREEGARSKTALQIRIVSLRTGYV